MIDLSAHLTLSYQPDTRCGFYARNADRVFPTRFAAPGTPGATLSGSVLSSHRTCYPGSRSSCGISSSTSPRALPVSGSTQRPVSNFFQISLQSSQVISSYVFSSASYRVRFKLRHRGHFSLFSTLSPVVICPVVQTALAAVDCFLACRVRDHRCLSAVRALRRYQATHAAPPGFSALSAVRISRFQS